MNQTPTSSQYKIINIGEDIGDQIKSLVVWDTSCKVFAQKCPGDSQNNTGYKKTLFIAHKDLAVKPYCWRQHTHSPQNRVESSWYWQDQVFLLALITILTVLSRVLEDKKVNSLPAINPRNCNNDYHSKICPLVQKWHRHCGSNQSLSDGFSDLLHRRTYAGITNLAKNQWWSSQPPEQMY